MFGVGFRVLLSVPRRMQPAKASTSWVTGPALPQVAAPEPLLIIRCRTVTNKGHFPADRGWQGKVLLLPLSEVGTRHRAQPGYFI